MQILQVDEHFNSVGHLSIVTHKNIIQQILMKPQYPQHLSCEFPFTARSPPIWAHWSPLLLRIWWNHSSRTSLTASTSGSQECWVINVILLINHKNRLLLFYWYIKLTSYSIFLHHINCTVIYCDYVFYRNTILFFLWESSIRF